MLDTPVSTDAFADVRPLLSPRAIAVVGASDAPGNLGGVAVSFLRRFGFPGGIYPVNPNARSVTGLACYASVADLPEPVDLAVVAVGAERVCAVVRDCAAAGIRHGIVWAGGFAEDAREGVARQEELVALCRASGFRLLGPNCLGAINSALGMTATFASFLLEEERLVPGRISIVGQSGGLVSSCQALAQRMGVGFRAMVSTGNEAILTTADFVHAFAEDDGTKVIAAYVEGVRDGARFVAALEAARRAGKPVVLIKGGATPASARAAAAHTGALAGEGRVWEAVLAEHGVVPVESLEELLDVALFLDSLDLAKLPAGGGVAPITFGGGFGVLAADQCARKGLSTPPLSKTSREKLAHLVPPTAAIGNPFDLTPVTYNEAAWMARLPAALAVIASDPAIDTILFQCGPMGRHANELLDVIRALREETDKTVCLAWPLAPKGMVARARGEGFFVFEEYARAINAVARAARYRGDRDRPPRRAAEASGPAIDWSAHVPSPTAGEVVPEHVCHRILSAAGLPVAAAEMAASVEEAVAAARRLGFPLAMKAVTTALTHRARAGLVALDVRAESEVRAVFARLGERADAAGIALDGVYLQRMAADGVELLVSAFRDPTFGVMVACGAGGRLTEAIDAVILARAPFDETFARDLVGQLGLVRAAEAGERLDVAPLAAFVAGFSRLAASAPWRSFTLEVNPVRWTAGGVVAVDGLVVIEAP